MFIIIIYIYIYTHIGILYIYIYIYHIQHIAITAGRRETRVLRRCPVYLGRETPT